MPRPVGVFVGPALPGGMGVAEPDVDLAVAGHFGGARSGWQAISRPRSQVMLLRRPRGSRFIWRLKPSGAASAPLPSILHNASVKRLIRGINRSAA